MIFEEENTALEPEPDSQPSRRRLIYKEQRQNIPVKAGRRTQRLAFTGMVPVLSKKKRRQTTSKLLGAILWKN